MNQQLIIKKLNYFKNLFIKKKNFFEGIDLKRGPDFIDLEPTLGCNLKCRMCHVSYMKEKISYLPIEKIDWSFCKDKAINIGNVFEPTIHPKFNDLISILNKLNCEITITTNAHNLNKKNIPAIFDSDLKRVTFSFDGITKNTYEEIRVGGNYHQTLDNIQNFTNKFHNTKTEFMINYTVLKSNLNEVPEAPKFWDKKGIHCLNFIGMVVRNNNKYILDNNLLHVKKEYFQALDDAMKNTKSNKLKILLGSSYYKSKYKSYIINKTRKWRLSPHYLYGYNENSILENNCYSPFSTVRITWEGAVHLCHLMGVGNLLEKKMEEIWLSEEATKLRETVLHKTILCEKCEYFKFCIMSNTLDVENKENYFNNNIKYFNNI